VKVTLLDIETTPNVGYTWGKWEQNVISFKKEWELLSFAHKELGKQPTECIARPDFKDVTDKSLTVETWKILDASDVLIGHNIDQFDNRKLRAKFIEHKLPPPSPYKTIDTKKIAKSQFAFNSNSLNDLAKTLQLGSKVKTGGFDLWLGCMEGDAKAWKRMRLYNRHDVILLEKVYMAMRSYFPGHPNFRLLDGVQDGRPGCPVCKSAKVQRRGYRVLVKRRCARFQCQGCGHWYDGKAEAA
jgi:hypothetical protein